MTSLKTSGIQGYLIISLPKPHFALKYCYLDFTCMCCLQRDLQTIPVYLYIPLSCGVSYQTVIFLLQYILGGRKDKKPKDRF